MVLQHDTVVIGAGQAGLAMSAVLRDRGRDHVVLERSRIAERWRSERWDSLRFQFPNWSIALPGFRYTGRDPDGFATAAEIVALLEGYAADAPVREHTEVTLLERAGDEFSITTTDGQMRARQVVVATGPFQRPRIPPLAAELPSHIAQTDPTCYRNPDSLAPGSVLVVGAGASGIQIAEELAGAGREVILAASPRRRVPRRFRGRDIYWWLDRMGRLQQTIDTFPGRQWPPHTAVTGVNGGYDIDLRMLADTGTRVIGSVRGISGTRVIIDGNANQVLDEADAAYSSFVEAARVLAASLDEAEALDDDDAVVPSVAPVPEVAEIDLNREAITNVIWATGYEYDYGWLHTDVIDADNRPAQQRGVTAIPGLFFLGLHWMHTFKSGLLAGVGSDALFLADTFSERARTI